MGSINQLSDASSHSPVPGAPVDAPLPPAGDNGAGAQMDLTSEMPQQQLSDQQRCRMRAYKNVGLDADEMRRRREEVGAQLRRQRHDEQVFKRRSLLPPTLAVAADAVAEIDPADATSRMDECVDSVRDSPGSPAPTLGELEALVNQLRSATTSSDDSETRLEATRRVRHLLCRADDPPIDALLESGALPWLVAGLRQSEQPQLQFESAWAITNVASGLSCHTRAVAESPDALDGLVALADSWECQPFQLTEQAVWALANVAGDSPAMRDAVLAAGAIEPISRAILHRMHASGRGGGGSLIRVGAWCLANLCRGGHRAGHSDSDRTPPPPLDALRPSLPLLARLAFSADPGVLADACWALAYLSDGDNDRVQAVIDTGVCRRLVALTRNPHQPVARAALRAVGNLVTGDDIQTQVLLNCQLLPALSELLAPTGPDWARKDACWVASNVAAGNRTQIQALMDCSLVQPVLEALRCGEFGIRKEAAWFVANAASGGSPDQVGYLVQCGCLQPLCDLLTLPDCRIVEVALTALEAVLRSGAPIAEGRRNPYAHLIEECSGFDRLEYLQSHENERIYRRTHQIIDRYFASSDDEDIYSDDISQDGHHHHSQNQQLVPLELTVGVSTVASAAAAAAADATQDAPAGALHFQEPNVTTAGFHF